MKKIKLPIHQYAINYKVSPTYPISCLVDGPLIRLWKANPNNSPKLPIEVPSLVLYYPIWGNDASRSMEGESL